jgi:hypothetical protein
MCNDMLAEVTKDKVAKGDTLGLAGGRGEGVLTQLHCEEEGANDKVGSMVVLIGLDAPLVG